MLMSRRNLMCIELPLTYDYELEYVTIRGVNDNTVFVTPILPFGNAITEFTFKFKIHNSMLGRNRCIFCSRKDLADGSMTAFSLLDNTVRLDCSDVQQPLDVNAYDGNTHEIVYSSVRAAVNTAYRFDNIEGTFSLYSSTNMSKPRSFVFGASYANIETFTEKDNECDLDFYKFSFLHTTIKMPLETDYYDFIPVSKNGVAYIYDTFNKKLLSPISGQFIAGPRKNI